jgi:hypothetical protein
MFSIIGMAVIARVRAICTFDVKFTAVVTNFFTEEGWYHLLRQYYSPPTVHELIGICTTMGIQRIVPVPQQYVNPICLRLLRYNLQQHRKLTAGSKSAMYLTQFGDYRYKHCHVQYIHDFSSFFTGSGNIPVTMMRM